MNDRRITPTPASEKPAISTTQLAARMNKTLNSIWRMGDRDECSLKHICHSLAAISCDQDWYRTVDYNLPWPYGGNAKREHTKENNIAKLDLKWQKIVALKDQVGHTKFEEGIALSDFGTYQDFYKGMYYEPQADGTLGSSYGFTTRPVYEPLIQYVNQTTTQQGETQ